MQLGHCRFDVGKGELTNLESGNVWHLPRAELQVISLLVDYQGKVVAKALLRSGNGEQPALSDSSVARAVFTLRSFLGPQYEPLIETVKGQGYLLRHHRCRKNSHSNPNKINRHMPKLIALLTISLVLAIGSYLGLIALSGNVIPPPPPLKVSTIELTSGQVIRVILYAHSKTNNTLLLEQELHMLQSLSHCPSSSWKRIYLSLSHDKQVLNITMRGEKLGQSIIRNLKISDLRQPKQFINKEWIQNVNICG
ncbi:MAG: helix-turn-helix domain-containing protein [Shewanella sp.]|nr:helix-turn-helix domain-containing protein [Shewanella sp.]